MIVFETQIVIFLKTAQPHKLFCNSVQYGEYDTEHNNFTGHDVITHAVHVK